MKHINIECPQGYEIDKEKSTFEKIVFKEIKKELPKKWKDLGFVSGYFVDVASRIKVSSVQIFDEDHKNIFSTEEQAEASVALAQITQLREVYRQGWIPNWAKEIDSKYCISMVDSELVVEFCCKYRKFLTFQNEKTAMLFLKNFRDLIKQASPLLFG